MSPRRHLDDLFSAAYEDELSPIEEARFHAHMQSCAPCAAAYAEFRATVEALRELPKAQMPHVVHLPSTSPVAERPPRPRISLGWFNLGILRRFPATAIAGAFVVVLAVTALLHGSASPTSGTSSRPSCQAPPRATRPTGRGRPPPRPAARSSALPGCTRRRPASPTRTWPPTRRSRRSTWSSPRRRSRSLRASRQSCMRSCWCRSVAVHPGTGSAPVTSRAVLPCVSVSVVSSGQNRAVIRTPRSW